MIPIVIPSYEPDDRFPTILKEIAKAGLGPVVVVDDGSGDAYNGFFEEAETLVSPLGGVVLHHEVNKGKGRALKTAFSYILENMPEAIGCVTADSDGQHSVECIKKCMDSLEKNPNSLILGVRDFSGSAFMKELLDVEGERFEFETRMLIVTKDKYPIVEVPIKTIYDSKENHQTHFNPVKDSIRIYKIFGAIFAKFLFSSLSSCVIDLVLFYVFCRLFDQMFDSAVYVMAATIAARVLSAAYNYTVNYLFVFRSGKSHTSSFPKYVALAIAQMSISAGLVTLLVWMFRGVPELVFKIPVDLILFLLSYYIQRRFVY